MKRDEEIKKQLKKTPLSVFLIIGCVMMACLFVFMLLFRIEAKGRGRELGDNTGTLVGRAIGSAEGLLDGKAAAEKAIEDALNPEDTEADLATKIREEQKLEVLVASGSFVDKFMIGRDYAMLLSMDYDAIYTVDLSTAEIYLRSDGLHILVDEPKLEFIPKGNVEKMAEWQSGGIVRMFTGSADKANTAFNNYMNMLCEKAEETMNEDEYLNTAAKQAAEEQLAVLAKAASVSKVKPEVFTEFRNR